jgi:NadR type nicotinamide-nucleotide adenylyltransferase
MGIKIAITGPESTGKSWLSNKLAMHFKCGYVAEFSRKYFEGRSYDYNQNDLDEIARGQLTEEMQAKKSGDLLICDTDILAIKVWSEIVFGNTSKFIEDQVVNHEYDLYLLCNIDIPWKPDRFRKNESDRQLIFDMFVNELNKLNVNFRIVSGKGEKRFQKAIGHINEFLDERGE